MFGFPLINEGIIERYFSKKAVKPRMEGGIMTVGICVDSLALKSWFLFVV